MELTDRTTWENSFAARISRLSSKHRQKMIELAGWPPDETRVPASFWIEVEDDMKRELAILLYLIWLASSQEHGGDWHFGESAATVYAQQRAADLARSYVTTSQAQLTHALTTATCLT